MEEGQTPLIVPPKRSRLGTVLGAIVMVGVLILGGLYIWGAKIEKERQQNVEETLRIMNERKAAPGVLPGAENMPPLGTTTASTTIEQPKESTTTPII